MRINVPQSDRHPLVRISVITPKGTTRHTMDDTHRVMEINLPSGVSEDDVSVVAEFCDSRERVDDRMKPVNLRQAAPMQPKRVEKPAFKRPVEPVKPDVPKAESQPEAKPEHKPGAKLEPRAESEGKSKE